MGILLKAIHLQPLIILQKNIIRIISFSRYKSPTKLLFQQYNILPLKKLGFLRPGLQLYKYEFGIIPIPLCSLFTKKSMYGTIFMTMLILMSLFTRSFDSFDSSLSNKNRSNVSYCLRNSAFNYNAFA